MIPVYKRKGFDTYKYLDSQIKAIQERVNKFNGKLYLEFGGKLCYDFHASRVLPGYEPTAKVQLLKKLRDIEIIYCVGAKDIQRGRVRRDFGLTYDNQTLKDIADLKIFGLNVKAVVISRFDGESLVKRLKHKLEIRGIDTYIYTEIKNYPNDVNIVVSKDGYGKQPYIKTDKSIIIVTGAGGGSGKMSFCLSQMYHDRMRGIKSGFAKFETFPIWNLPLNHPVNIAYEASTADLRDVNIIDPFHKDAYGIKAVNYNRDIENFKILRDLIVRVVGDKNYAATYKSPTDMGVNMAKAGIINDKVIRSAAKQEIIRRYFRYNQERIEGIETQATVDQMQEILKKAGVKATDRSVVKPARDAKEKAKIKLNKGFNGVYCGAAIELLDGRIITGKNSLLLNSESAVVLNSIKALSGIDDKIDLLSEKVIQKIITFKKEYLESQSGSLNLEETLIALSISATTNKISDKALKNLNKLKGCEMHLTYLPSQANETMLIKLGLNFTTDSELVI